MFNNLFSKFSHDLGIDLGTTKTLVYVRGRGIVINEPSVVAINTRTDTILAVGDEARKMLGKTPPYIQVSRPLVNGIISDFEVTEKMLKYFIDQVHRKSYSLIPRPRVVIGIPLNVTGVERKAVEDAALSAGAREVFLVEEPMAAAIGARLPIQEAVGNLVIDIGGGTTEIAVISLGGIVSSRTLPTAGNELDSDIIQYVRDKFNLYIGEATAEDIKIKIGSVAYEDKTLEMEVRGRDVVTGLPRVAKISSLHIKEAVFKTIRTIVDNIKSVVENTPPELVSEIYERGILLSGGGAQLRGLPELIKSETQIPTTVMDDPVTSVVRGTSIILEDMENLKNILVPTINE
ncbi:MAG: rod shape-determining protein [Patescibacteria group bacterium]|nr:rod shape-determining protein [Patescibacteria group bacterium]